MENKKSYNPKSGFKVPDNYFGNLESKIMASINEDKGILHDLKEDNGFKVPANYFETLESRIFEKIEKPAPKVKVISIFGRKELYAVAAVAAIFIGIISTVLYQPVPQQTLNNVEVSALEDYLDSGNVEFEYNDISSFIYEEGYVLEKQNSFDVSDDAVFDYLNENIEDPSLIIE